MDVLDDNNGGHVSGIWMYQQQPNWPPQYPPNGLTTEVRYIRRDLDHLQDRVSTLETKADQKLTDMVDWKLVAIIFVMTLGFAGHITIDDIKAFIIGGN